MRRGKVERSPELNGETIPVTAAGGILFNAGDKESVRILLIHRRGVWDLPKGKLEEGESIGECARREVAEEVGCPLPDAFDEVATTYHEYREDGRLIGKTTHWFPMVTDTAGGLSPESQEGIHEVGWYSLAKARAMVGFPNLGLVIDKFEEWYKKQGHDL